MEAAICEAVDEAESDCDSEDDEDDPFAYVDEQHILNNYLSAWYNIIQPSASVCVSALFKQALIFQWLNFGQFALFKQRINFPNYTFSESNSETYVFV